MCAFQCDRVSMDGWPDGSQASAPEISRREPGRVPGSAVARSAARAPCAGSLAAALKPWQRRLPGAPGSPSRSALRGRSRIHAERLMMAVRWRSFRGGTAEGHRRHRPPGQSPQPPGHSASCVLSPGGEHRAWRICRPRPWAPVTQHRAPVARLRVAPGASNQSLLPPEFRLPERHSSSASSLSPLR